jgi:nucleoside-diphosphate-sugar epimerase
LTALRDAHVLVLGAAGFLGSNLVRHLLAAGARVHVLVRRASARARLADVEDRLAVHEGDLAEPATVGPLLERIRPDLVFHLAAGGNAAQARGPATLFADNVLAAQNLIAATEPLPDCRIVYTASSLELARTGAPLGESTPIAPVNRFGAYKAAATLLLQSAARDDGRDIVILRPFAIYGPREPRRRLIPTAIAAGIAGETLPLTRPGLVRDYVYAADVCRACLLAATARGVSGEVFHLASGRETSNEAIVSVIEQCLGSPIRRDVGAYAAHDCDTERWCADVSKARRVLGWTASTTLQDGIRATIDWIERGGDSGG